MDPVYVWSVTVESGQSHNLGGATARINRPSKQDLTDTAAEWMPPALFEAWQVIRRDLEVPGAIVPALAQHDWSDDHELQVTAATWWPDGSGAGISVAPHEPLADRVAMLADQLQDHEVEALWRAELPAVWPHCPTHPNTHPLRAEVRDGVAVWVCGAELKLISPIGELCGQPPVT